MVKRWLSNNRRLASLLVMFLVIGSGTLIYLQFYQKYFSVSAATPYTVNVGNGVPYTANSIKAEADKVYQKMHEKMPKYLGTPKFNQIWVLNSTDMKNYCISAGWPQDLASSIDGEYDLINRITLRDTIFNGGMNNSHVVIGHEMIHGFVVRRQTRSRNLVEEGMTEYLAAKYLYGPKGAYPNEVQVTGEILDTFARLGDTNKDETLQKIMFQEGFDAGLDSRLNKYLPSDQTSAFAYLNTMYNNKHYDKATAWLQSIKGEEISKPGSPSPSAVGKTSAPAGTPVSNLSPVPLDSSILGKIRFPKTNITSIPDLLTKLVYIFLPAAGAWAVIALIWSGIIYITAAGNTERQEKAKKNMTWAITGIVIIALSGLMVYTFARILEGTQPMPTTSSTPSAGTSVTPSGAISPSTTPSGSHSTNPTTPTPRMTST